MGIVLVLIFWAWKIEGGGGLGLSGLGKGVVLSGLLGECLGMGRLG